MTTLESSLVADDFQLVVFDLYRDIHKGIRAELFALTSAAGSLDPHDTFGWMAFAGHVAAVGNLLTMHAYHEDTYVDPAMHAHLPELSATVRAEHEALEHAFASITEVARAGARLPAEQQRRSAHLAYLNLAAFTSDYLAHQAVEETVIMPLLEQAIGVEAVVGIHLSIITSIPPEEMGRCLTLMLPAMNLDDRVEMLGGMRATAPAEAFAGVVSLARSVLRPMDFDALASRLELS